MLKQWRSHNSAPSVNERVKTARIGTIRRVSQPLAFYLIARLVRVVLPSVFDVYSPAVRNIRGIPHSHRAGCASTLTLFDPRSRLLP